MYKSTNSPLAREVIERIGAIYAIEAEIRGTSAQQRLEARQLKSRPLMDALKMRLTEVVGQFFSQSPLAEAINYTLNHWDGLTLFLADGRVEVDSNTVERSMRPIALGRNYAKLRIMRSPVPNFLRTNHFQGSGLRIISKALKELHQLIRSSVPREVGDGRLQLTQGAFLH